METGEEMGGEGQVSGPGGEGETAGQEGVSGCGSEVTETGEKVRGHLVDK